MNRGRGGKITVKPRKNSWSEEVLVGYCYLSSPAGVKIAPH